MSTLRTDNIGNRAGTSQTPIETVLQGAAKAWAQMDGSGTAAFRDSFGFSSLVDTGVGRYTINFSVPRPSAYYAVALGANGSFNPALGAMADSVAYNPTASNFSIGVDTLAGAATDSGLIFLSAFGDPT